MKGIYMGDGTFIWYHHLGIKVSTYDHIDESNLG